MPISRKVAALGALGLTLAGGAALGQQSPESLLPPGFNEPVAPQPTPSARSTPRLQLDLGAGPAAPPVATPSPTPTPAAPPPPIDPALLAQYELPDYARRPLSLIGPTGVESGGLAPDAFGRADGRFLEVLMRRTRAPIASRWLHMALRRALMSRLDTPRGVDGADFAAERAWLLLRMGEAVAARAVVQSVDVENYTPKMDQVAMQAALATGDPSAMCPVVAQASERSTERAWTLARAMCASLEGEGGTAASILEGARRRGTASGIDLLLAEKVVGVGSNGRRAVTIEWDGVNQLNAWRFGLATATGVDIPQPLMDRVGPQVTYWRALAPTLVASARAASAELAASQGVLSSAALIDLYGAVDDEQEEAPGAVTGIARDLRAAYVEAALNDRLDALRQLWNEPASRRGKYARLVLTSRAAIGVTPGAEGTADDAGRIIASLLSAGLDLQAMRWADHVPRGSQGWALLALADPTPTEVVRYADANSYADDDADSAGLHGKMLAAGLAGLGRLSPGDTDRLAESVGLSLVPNRWARAIGFAARHDQPATVLLLAASAMGTTDWRGVAPEALYHICAALKRVGLEGEARMIAAEAISRV